jgi:nucleoside-diphosphate-sugar epimerase
MRVLVIGGGGAIGQATARAFVERGDTVLWTSRQAQPSSRAYAEGHVRIDRARPDEIARLVRDQHIDTVVDMIAYVVADTQPLLDALQGLIARHVLISSCDVYRNYGLLQRLERGRPDPGPLDETAPLRTSRFPYRGAQPRAADDPARWMDDYDKIPIEAAVREMACDWTILRLPMVYGPGDQQRRFRWAIRPMQSCVPVLEAPRPWLAWTTGYGFVGNVGAAIAHAAGHARAARAVFNLADEPPMDHWAWAERFRAATRWEGEVVATDGDTPFAQAISDMDLSVSLDVSVDRLFTELGFRPPYDLADAARVTALDEGGR